MSYDHLHLPIQELLDADRAHECDGCGTEHVCVRIASIAELPTRFGDFHIVAFYNNKDGKEHAAIVKGDVTSSEDIPVRLHSECLTGDALGSLRCDCGSLLARAGGVWDNGGRGALTAPIFLQKDFSWPSFLPCAATTFSSINCSS